MTCSYGCAHGAPTARGGGLHSSTSQPNLTRFWTLQPTETTQCAPQKVLRSSRNMDECQGLPHVHFSDQPETVLATGTLQLPSAAHKWCLC